ncbi:hypothetical protein A8C32_17685 [Flavivirga aquatica]|uniref:Membrane-binding protein n=1 Tax=Flavivirga aquatica TaxID=1849968 RepID=A0A1E5T8F9_9FLAO|nr:hypothetical protein [Flavivirga aquatica]OEK07628.1 hypothetical protein A8C32_17685 [Flavivirga aquatica]
MENSILKQIVFLIIVFLYTVAYAQDLKKFGYVSLTDYEYEEIIKNGIPKTMDGNFIVTSQKEGKIIFLSIKHFKDGKKVGEWKTFWNLLGNGLKLNFVANYQSDVLNGYYFNTDNHTSSEKGFYKNGKKNGSWMYFKANDCNEKITYRNGVKWGSYSFKNKFNNITGQYKKGGGKAGVWISKSSFLEIITKEFYKNGKLDKKEIITETILIK